MIPLASAGMELSVQNPARRARHRAKSMLCKHVLVKVVWSLQTQASVDRHTAIDPGRLWNRRYSLPDDHNCDNIWNRPIRRPGYAVSSGFKPLQCMAYSKKMWYFYLEPVSEERARSIHSWSHRSDSDTAHNNAHLAKLHIFDVVTKLGEGWQL